MRGTLPCVTQSGCRVGAVPAHPRLLVVARAAGRELRSSLSILEGVSVILVIVIVIVIVIVNVVRVEVTVSIGGCSQARSGNRTGGRGGPLCCDERLSVGFVSGGEFAGQRGAFPGQSQGNPAFSRCAAKPQVPLLQHGFQRRVGLGRRAAGLGQPPSVCDAVFVHR